MKSVINYRIYFIAAVLFSTFYSCASLNKTSGRADDVVAMDINIQGNDPDLNMVNLDVLKFKLLDELENFQRVDLTLAAEDEKPKLVLDVNIADFLVWPKDERRSIRTFRRRIAVGTDANNRPVYQVVSASAEIVQVIIRTNAVFNTRLTLTDSIAKPFSRSFSSRYNWTSTYITNIRGDSRAVDPALYAYSMPPIDPLADDLLLVLATREMTKRLSNEIRSYFKASK